MLLLLMFSWVVGVVAALLLPALLLPLDGHTCSSLLFSVSATVVPLARLVLAAGYNSAAIFFSFCSFFLVLDRVRVRIS